MFGVQTRPYVFLLFFFQRLKLWSMDTIPLMVLHVKHAKQTSIQPGNFTKMVGMSRDSNHFTLM